MMSPAAVNVTPPSVSGTQKAELGGSFMSSMLAVVSQNPCRLRAMYLRRSSSAVLSSFRTSLNTISDTCTPETLSVKPPLTIHITRTCHAHIQRATVYIHVYKYMYIHVYHVCKAPVNTSTLIHVHRHDTLQSVGPTMYIIHIQHCMGVVDLWIQLLTKPCVAQQHM